MPLAQENVTNNNKKITPKENLLCQNSEENGGGRPFTFGAASKSLKKKSSKGLYKILVCFDPSFYLICPVVICEQHC